MATWEVIPADDLDETHTAVGDSYNLSSDNGVMRVTFYRDAGKQNGFNKKLSSFGLTGNWVIKYISEREN